MDLCTSGLNASFVRDTGQRIADAAGTADALQYLKTITYARICDFQHMA